MQLKLEFFEATLDLQLCSRIGPRRNEEVEAHAFQLVTLNWVSAVGIATKVPFTGVNCDRSVYLSILKLRYKC